MYDRGVREAEVPDIKLQRTRDGLSGYATLTFKEPSIFNASSEVGDVTGLYLVDDEGEISTTDVKVWAGINCGNVGMSMYIII